MTAVAARVVAVVELPTLPPRTLSKNPGNTHWGTIRRHFTNLRDDAGWQLREVAMWLDTPYTALTQVTVWRQCGVMADPDAIVTRTSAVRDAAEAVNLIANDAGISIGRIERVRVKTKSEQGVTITFETERAA